MRVGRAFLATVLPFTLDATVCSSTACSSVKPKSIKDCKDSSGTGFPEPWLTLDKCLPDCRISWLVEEQRSPHPRQRGWMRQDLPTCSGLNREEAMVVLTVHLRTFRHIITVNCTCELCNFGCRSTGSRFAK